MIDSPNVEIRIVPTLPEYFATLTALEQVVFGALADEEIFTPEMYAQQVAAFPDGQLTALANRGSGTWEVVGSTTTMLTNHAFADDSSGYYFDFIGRGSISTHDPQGKWLYGIAMAVHPEFRRLGVGKRMYAARRDLVRRMNLHGELVAGLLPGYAAYRDQFSVDDYVQRVVTEELVDPTLTMQLRSGFSFIRLLRGYVHDPRSNDTVTLLKRENPDRTDQQPL